MVVVALSCTAGALFVFAVFVFVFVWVRQRAWARSSTASAIYHTCVMSLVTCNWLRGETCGALDAESSDRGANPREASLRRECAWDCGHANAADTGKHAQASKHKQHKQKTGKHSQAHAGRQGQSSLGRVLHLPALSGVWRGALGMRVLLVLGEVLVSARLPRQSGHARG